MSVALRSRIRRFGSVVRVGVLVGALLPATAAHARIYNPGDFNDALTDPLTGVSLAERPDLIGTIIADLTVPFDNNDFYQGTIRTQVVRETVAGTLDFYYTIEPANDVFEVSGFKGFSVDADWREDLGKGASGIARSADGDTLDFVFNTGTTFVKTNATEFALVGQFRSFPDSSGLPAFATVYAPTGTPIPIPTALFAAPVAFGIAAYARRRFISRS